jgi:hypothetical protein
MERFYRLAVLFTLIFLIICLIFIGILMQYQNAGKKFPRYPTVCPDLWTNSVDGKTCSTSSGKNKGTLTGSSPSLTLSSVSTICEKKKWTKSNGVRWDGVSNYTGCV